MLYVNVLITVLILPPLCVNVAVICINNTVASPTLEEK